MKKIALAGLFAIVLSFTVAAPAFATADISESRLQEKINALLAQLAQLKAAQGGYTPVTPISVSPNNQSSPSTTVAGKSEIIGAKSVYKAGEAIKFSIRAFTTKGDIATPEMGFVIEANMHDNYDVYVNGARQQFYAKYNYVTKLWDVAMTAPSDTSKEYAIAYSFRCADQNLQITCSGGQSEGYFMFKIGTRSGKVVKDASITIMNPNGGEVFYDDGREVITNIKWKSENFGKTPVTIQLADTRGALVKTIATDVKNTGSYVWRSFKSIPSGKYKLYIHSSYNAPIVPVIEDYSDNYFEVFTEDLKSGTIDILYPDGGEKWEVDKKYTIKLDTAGSDWHGEDPTYVLLSRDYPEDTGKTGTQMSKRIGMTDSESFTYTVNKTDILDLGGFGSGFRIEAFSKESCCIQGRSAKTFSIAEGATKTTSTDSPGFKVVSPVNGDTLKIGKTYNITWKSPAEFASKTVHLVGYINGMKVDKYLGNTTGNELSYTISSYVTPPGMYDLWVCGRYCPYDGGKGASATVKVEY